MKSKIAALPLAFAVLATAMSGVAHAKKVCTNTYNPDGTRCTFCYYTTQPGSGSTVCIKIKAKGGSSSNAAAHASKLRLSPARR
ncbi:MAG: hypothetical protein RLZZ303_2726 [Candidatus Hydrogenedentota bacterium]|jgi:hypothetical protein